MRIALAAALFVACSGASSPPPAPVAPAAPRLLGRPIATAPLSDAEQTVYARATASLAATPPRLDGDATAWKGVMKTWLDQRVGAVRAVEEAVRALPEEQQRGLFAVIVSGVAMDDLVGDLLALPLPPSLQTGPYAKDVEAAYRETLESYALPLATAAKRRLARCRELAPAAPAALQPWAEYCAQRVGALAELEARVAARPARAKPRPTPAAMKDCAGGEQVPWEPDALPPDLKVKPKLVVLYDGDRLQGADRDRLLDAVTERVRAHTRLPLLSKRQLAAGEALVAQRKMTAKGPVCGQPPRLTQVLARKQRNLIVARVSTDCIAIIHQANDKRSYDEQPRCGLEVVFHRAGTLDRDGLPATLWAPVASKDAAAATWIAAARELSTDAPALGGVLGALSGGTGAPGVSVRNYGDDDPWLRVGDTLYGDTAAKIAACVDAPASFDIKLAISPSGETTDVALAPVTAPPAGSHVAECVRDALKATGFPCTRDGKPASVEVRMCVAPHR